MVLSANIFYMSHVQLEKRQKDIQTDKSCAGRLAPWFVRVVRAEPDERQVHWYNAIVSPAQELRFEGLICTLWHA